MHLTGLDQIWESSRNALYGRVEGLTGHPACEILRSSAVAANKTISALIRVTYAGGLMKGSAVSGEVPAQLDGDWVDSMLLTGSDSDTCFVFDTTIDRATLRALVEEHQRTFAEAGLKAEIGRAHV